MPEENLKEIVKYMSPKKKFTNDVIISEGKTGNHLYVLGKGKLQVTKVWNISIVLIALDEILNFLVCFLRMDKSFFCNNYFFTYLYFIESHFLLQ